MRKVSLLLGALMLVGGVSFATPKEKKEKKAKTESCSKEGKGSCCSKGSKTAKAESKEEIRGKKVSVQTEKAERVTMERVR